MGHYVLSVAAAYKPRHKAIYRQQRTKKRYLVVTIAGLIFNCPPRILHQLNIYRVAPVSDPVPNEKKSVLISPSKSCPLTLARRLCMQNCFSP